MLKIKEKKYLYITTLFAILCVLVRPITTYSLIVNDLIDYLKDGRVISPSVSLDQLSYPCNTDEAKEYQNNTLEEELNNLGIMNFLFNKGIIENTGDRALGNYYPTNLKNKGPYYSGFTEEENLAKVFAVCTGKHVNDYDPVPRKNPIAHWTFDGNISDSVGNNHGVMPETVTMHPNPTSGVNINVQNTAYSFDGNDFINLSTEGLPIGNSSRTVCSWVKTNTNSGYHWAFGYGSSDNRRSGIGKSFALGQNSNHLGVTGYGMDIWINDSVRIGQWQHLCASYDGTTGNVYLDGELKNSKPINWDTGTSGAYIGKQVPITEYFNGSVDEIRVYNRALKPQEITDIYNNTRYTGVDGQCNTTYINNVINIKPDNGGCSEGFATDVSGPDSFGVYKWSCSGQNGGLTASCQSKPQSPVNGICGNANGKYFHGITKDMTTRESAQCFNNVKVRCSSGEAKSFQYYNGKYSWYCAGLYQGTVSYCQTMWGPEPAPGSRCEPASANIDISTTGQASVVTSTFTPQKIVGTAGVPLNVVVEVRNDAGIKSVRPINIPKIVTAKQIEKTAKSIKYEISCTSPIVRNLELKIEVTNGLDQIDTISIPASIVKN